MSQTLSPLLQYGLQGAHTEDGWITPFLDSVKAVDHEAAQWNPGPGVTSIWEIVAHAVPYTESRLADYTGAPFGNEPDWPEVTDKSPEAWAAMQRRLETAITRLAEAVGNASDEQLLGTVEGRQLPTANRLLDIIIHDSYHAGQVVKITQLYQARGSA